SDAQEFTTIHGHVRPPPVRSRGEGVERSRNSVAGARYQRDAHVSRPEADGRQLSRNANTRGETSINRCHRSISERMPSPVGTFRSSTSSVIAIANTPSLSAAIRSRL